MPEKVTLADIEARLQHKTIHEIRQIARVLGVSRPADGKKERLIGELLKICSGELEPAPRATRGAPPKSEAYDRFFVADFERCRAELLSDGKDDKVASIGDNSGIFEGVLYFDDKSYFLTDGKSEDSSSDISVPDACVRRFNLRMGDVIKCTISRADVICGEVVKRSGVVSVLTVNGDVPESAISRRTFDEIPARPIDRRLPLSPCGAEGNIIDLFSPIAAGQRGIIVGAPASGATSLILSMAQSLARKKVETVCLLVGARPEEISEFSAAGVKTFGTAFYRSEEDGVRSANLAVEYCKRQTEYGKDVVLFIDNINRLSRAFSKCARSGAYGGVLKIFSAAKSGDDCSLTIIAALSMGESSEDSELYSRLRDACNLQINLSRKLAADSVFPAIDIRTSHAARAEKFLPADEAALASAARGGDPLQIIKDAEVCRTFAQFKEKLLGL